VRTSFTCMYVRKVVSNTHCRRKAVCIVHFASDSHFTTIYYRFNRGIRAKLSLITHTYSIIT
jgi:hypothetical protein